MLMTLLLAASLALAPPGDDPYRSAREGLDQLQSENERLREEVDLLRQQLVAPAAAAGVQTMVGRLVTVEIPPELQTPDAHGRRFVWNFGDGSTERPGYAAGHVYDTGGRYVVTLDGEAFATVDVLPRPAGQMVVLPPLVRGFKARANTLYLADPAGTRVTGSVDATAGGVTLRGLVFDLGVDAKLPAVLPGDDLAVIDCRVDSARSFIELNFGSRVDGLLLERVEQGGTNTLQRYLVGLFGDTSNVSVYDTAATNSNHEHILRLSGDPTGGQTSFASVHNNILSNLSERNGGPKGDMGKATVILQNGRFGHVEGNTLVGPSGAGPLPGKDGEGVSQWRWRTARWQDNQMAGGWHADHGLIGCTFTGNFVDVPDGGGILVHGKSDAHGGRLVEDLVVDNVDIVGRSGATLLEVRGQTGGVLLSRVRLGADPSIPAAENPMPSLRLANNPQAIGVELSEVTAPVIRSWPKPSLALCGGQNDKSAYRGVGEVAGLEASE